MADDNKVLNNAAEENDQDVKSVIDGAEDIINIASKAVNETKSDGTNFEAGSNDGSKTIANSFAGLPLETLIGSPFIAAAKAQQDLTATYVETVMGLTYGRDNDDDDKNKNKKVNTLNLTIERPVISEDGNKVEKKEFTVSAPILSLVPVPAFTMDEVVVDFEMEVKNSEVNTENQNSTVESTVGYKSFWGLSANIKGSVTSDSKHKRETDTSATYKIHARAVQHPPASGMEKLTDLLTQTMEPIISSGSNPGK